MNVWAAVRGRPLLAIAPLVALMCIGIGWGLGRHPTYSATSRLYVRVPATDAALYGVTDTAAGLASAYSRAGEATAVVASVARRLHLDPSRVAGDTTVTPVPDSPVVKIVGRSRSGAGAVRLANATSDALRQYVTTLNRSDATLAAALADFRAGVQAVGRARVRLRAVEGSRRASSQQLDAARTALDVATLRRDAARTKYTQLEQAEHLTLEPLRVATDASSDRISRLELFGFLGLLAGAALGLALATLGAALDLRTASGTDVAEALDLPLLGRIPEPPRAVVREQRLIMLEDPSGPHAEALRMVRSTLQFANVDPPAKVFMFVSAMAEEGKSATVANLGLLLAQTGERVVVIDLDLRRPRLARYLDLAPPLGVTDALLDGASVEDVIESVRRGRERSRGGGAVLAAPATLDVLAAGVEPAHPGGLVRHPALAGLVETLRDRYDTILIDTPAALAVGDAIAMSPLADAIVVVARSGRLTRAALRDFSRILSGIPTPKLGVVVTNEGTEARYTYGY